MARPEEKTILVVDDEDDVREYLAMVLEEGGFNVVTAADGEEALQQVKKQPPDFISLDLIMPRKSGIKFLYELRHNKEWAKIPFVILTAHARDDLGKSHLEDILSSSTISGAGIYLEKPVKPETYLRHICREVGVECEVPVPDEPDMNDRRREINRLLQDVDAEKMREIVKMLKK
jgi:CheY-like chemotaxis protein